MAHANKNYVMIGIGIGFSAACAAGLASTILLSLLGINSMLIKMGVDAGLGAFLVSVITLQPWVREISKPKNELPSPEDTALLIKKRRSIFLKDFNGEEVQ